MPLEFKLPDLGEGVAEGEIVEWKVAVGDSVEEDQPLVEVMTDKATVEIPSPRAGVIASIAHEAGAVVPVGDVLVVIDDGGGAAAPAKAEAKAETPAPAPTPAAPATKAPAPAAAPAAPAAPAAARSEGGPVLAAPATRKLARELGVDLEAASGSGPRGRVTKEDVRAVAEGGAAPAAAAAAAPARAPQPITRPTTGAASETTITPYRGLRKKIGDQMVRSAFTAPHFTLVEEVDMTALVELRNAAKPLAEKRGTKLTYLPFIMKAVCGALRHHPTLNSILDEAEGELVTYRDVNLGFALDTEKGLVVPVIRDAGRRSVFEIADELSRLSEAGREGTITRDEMMGSTITVTSAGSIGGLFATPIINHPEVAILGVYRMEDRPVVMNGDVVVRKMMYLSITLDHRVIDGGEAARFMNTMKRLLGDPRNLLLEA
ncbi:MAG: dihydrolipoamide acetyltransferase family protein [Planctomycetota bacterium]